MRKEKDLCVIHAGTGNTEKDIYCQAVSLCWQYLRNVDMASLCNTSPQAVANWKRKGIVSRHNRVRIRILKMVVLITIVYPDDKAIGLICKDMLSSEEYLNLLKVDPRHIILLSLLGDISYLWSLISSKPKSLYLHDVIDQIHNSLKGYMDRKPEKDLCRAVIDSLFDRLSAEPNALIRKDIQAEIMKYTEQLVSEDESKAG